MSNFNLRDRIRPLRATEYIGYDFARESTELILLMEQARSMFGFIAELTDNDGGETTANLSKMVATTKGYPVAAAASTIGDLVVNHYKVLGEMIDPETVRSEVVPMDAHGGLDSHSRFVRSFLVDLIDIEDRMREVFEYDSTFSEEMIEGMIVRTHWIVTYLDMYLAALVIDFTGWEVVELDAKRSTIDPGENGQYL